MLTAEDIKKKILSFDISSKRKIILVALKKNIKDSDLENLGAKFYDQFNDHKLNKFIINSETLSSNQKNILGHFVHGLKLKSSYITNILKCVPPGDKPMKSELLSCSNYFEKVGDLLGTLVMGFYHHSV